MWGTSDFRFVGTVCTDCVLSLDGDRPIARFAIATKVKFAKHGRCRFPLVAFGDVAKLAASFCRIGSRVAVSGTIVSEDITNAKTGETSVRTFFYAYEILCISKPRQKSLTAYARRFSELTELSPTDPLIPPKRSK